VAIEGDFDQFPRLAVCALLDMNKGINLLEEACILVAINSEILSRFGRGITEIERE
jgi:hypothetical protein